MFKLFVAAALVLAVTALPARIHLGGEGHGIDQWASFKAKFEKTYSATEEESRKAIFMKNLDLVNEQNAKFARGEATYKMGINQFSDLTQDEFRSMYLSKFTPKTERNEVRLPEAQADSVDWRTKGAVTPVKNQGQCGSCWSFSTTGSMEGAVAIATGKLVSFSEQQLMDCSTAEGNMGCNGGLMDNAFKYIIKNGGLDTEEDYPYTARDGTCNSAKAAKHAGSITDFTDVPKEEDKQMEAAVEKGPVSVAIEADQAGFQGYHSGVFNGPCGTQLDHGVLVVGYTAEYWIVKNSWGETWGDQGYIMMSRSAGGAAGLCGILTSASYPTAGAPGPSPPPPPPGPSPPPPPPGPATYHYEDPKPNGCQAGEENVEVTGVQGDFCSPSCGLFKKCPTDLPPATTARPECVLEKQGSSSPTNCALICNPAADGECPANASCKAVSTVGLCTYDD